MLWVFLGTAALLVCLWLVSRLRGPTDAQAEALALMQERAPLPPGDNAFPAIWMLAYDVPDPELERMSQLDVASSKVTVTPKGDGLVIDSLRSGLAGFEQQHPSISDAQLFCKGREGDCLDRIRADPAAYAGLIERNRPLLDRVVALRGYGYYRSPEYDPAQTMLPPVRYAEYDLTRVAWQFAQGEVDAALTGACDGAGAWRRLGANADSLMIRGVSAGYVDGYSRLLATMLGELPVDHPIPSSCTIAFAPPTVADASVCEAMRGEFSVSSLYIRQRTTGGGLADAKPFTKNVFFDPDKALGILASGNAWACADVTNAALQRDIRVDPESHRAGLWRLECVANISGCILADIAFPAYYNYQWKAQDHAARLELMAALLWLRSNATPGQPLQSQLTGYWEANRRGDRQIRFEDDGRSVALQQYAQGPDEWWVLPLFPAAGQGV